MDIDLDYMAVDEFMEKMNEVLPDDIQITKAIYLKKEESIASLISWAFYEINFDIIKDKSKEEIEDIINTWLCKEEIMITKLKKKGKKKIERQENIKNLIGNIVLKEINHNNVIIDTLIKAGDNGNLKPTNLMEALNRDTTLNIDMDSITIKRLGLYAEKDKNIYKPL